MTHADAFLEDILANPDDDGPRLIYADWLEENGQPERAEFIRVQIALASGRSGAGLEAREQELLGKYGADWAKPLRGLVQQWSFQRGFVADVRVEFRTFRSRADQIFHRAPVQHLRLFSHSMSFWDRPHFLAALADCPYLARLLSLDLSHSHLGSHGVETLAVSEHLTRLSHLNLASNRIGPAGARALASSPLLSRLASLDLSGNELGPGGVRILADALEELTRDCQGLPLRRLDLVDNDLGQAGRRVVTSSPVLHRIARL